MKYLSILSFILVIIVLILEETGKKSIKMLFCV